MEIKKKNENGTTSYIYVSEAEPTNVLKNNERRFFNIYFSDFNKAIDFATNSVKFSDSSNKWYWNIGDGEKNAEFSIKNTDDEDYNDYDYVMTTNNNVEIWELEYYDRHKPRKYLLAIGKLEKVAKPRTKKISVTLEYEFELQKHV